VHEAIVALLVVCEKFGALWDGPIGGSRGEDVFSSQDAKAIEALQKESGDLISFITAGVRSVSRAAADPLLVALAERLEWLADRDLLLSQGTGATARSG